MLNEPSDMTEALCNHLLRMDTGGHFGSYHLLTMQCFRMLLDDDLYPIMQARQQQVLNGIVIAIPIVMIGHLTHSIHKAIKLAETEKQNQPIVQVMEYSSEIHKTNTILLLLLLLAEWIDLEHSDHDTLQSLPMLNEFHNLVKFLLRVYIQTQFGHAARVVHELLQNSVQFQQYLESLVIE